MSYLDAIETAPAGLQTHAVGLLLAAGQGRRYARLAPGADKLLARLPDGRALAEAAALALLDAVPRVLAIVQPAQRERAALLRAAGCEVLVAPQAEGGMGASLAAGARALLADARGARALVVALADMPWVRPATIRTLAACVPAHAIAAPLHDGQRGHPVVFAACLWPALARLDGDTGARGLLSGRAAHLVPTADAGVIRDVDLPRQLAGGAPSAPLRSGAPGSG